MSKELTGREKEKEQMLRMNKWRHKNAIVSGWIVLLQEVE